MSTKIYNGYKLTNPPKNLKEVRDILFKFKEQAMAYYRKKYYGLVARDIVRIYDDAVVLKEVDYAFPHFTDDKIIETIHDQNKYSSIWGAVTKAVDRRANIFRKQPSRSHDFFQYEFYCNIIILPCNEQVFLMMFTEERGIQDIFDKMEDIEEYPYWDNSDQPDGMTWEEWKERGVEWDEALGTGVPSQNGFGIDIIDGTFYVQIYPGYKAGPNIPGAIDEILKYILEFDKRVYRLTRIIMGKEWHVENAEEIKKKVSEGAGSFYAVHSMFEDFYKKETERVSKKKAEIAEILKEDFTKEDLEMKCQAIVEFYNVKREKREEPVEVETGDVFDD